MARRGSGHFATGFRTGATSLSTFAAVVHWVPRAFLAAGVADFGAQLADAFREFGISRHLPLGQGADGGAAPIQANAPLHRADIVLAQTSGRAAFAGRGAVVTGFNARLVTFVSHDESSF